jgi:hypothetical protein
MIIIRIDFYIHYLVNCKVPLSGVDPHLLAHSDGAEQTSGVAIDAALVRHKGWRQLDDSSSTETSFHLIRVRIPRSTVVEKGKGGGQRALEVALMIDESTIFLFQLWSSQKEHVYSSTMV